jgi:hypothetical protein
MLCLEAYNASVRAREDWYGRKPKLDEVGIIR